MFTSIQEGHVSCYVPPHFEIKAGSSFHRYDGWVEASGGILTETAALFCWLAWESRYRWQNLLYHNTKGSTGLEEAPPMHIFLSPAEMQRCRALQLLCSYLARQVVEEGDQIECT